MAKGQIKSPYFSRKRVDLVSCLPFPSTSASSFGLIQEQLAHDPFRLLIATIFLNRTKAEVAIPVLHSVFEKYPTINAVADADIDELVSMIRRLGFQNSRAKKCIAIAKLWSVTPPEKGKRFRRLHYPNKDDGSDVKAGEYVSDDDVRVAWEIAYLPGVGAYAIDSWRIFCRDVQRGLAADWNGLEAEDDFLPEWKSVRPKDKELRAFLTWMWLKEGWVWNQDTGERILTSKKVSRAAQRGGLVLSKSNGGWVLESINIRKPLIGSWDKDAASEDKGNSLDI